ncbi:hypothetical protein LBMAG21_05340 [Armatimonadota bacterium]|nr:hypothetical protein LBMAG21_05340 [Armatimonadota bacterium]
MSIEEVVLPLVSTIRACPYDLIARARLAQEACVSLLNPDLAGQPYSYLELHTSPPVAMHTPWDYGDTTGHLLESLTLLRIMTGTAPDERDTMLSQHLYSHQGDDGLIVVPPAPWTVPHQPTVELEWTQRGALMAWTTRYLAFEDQLALEAAERLVTGLYHTAIWHSDYCWFPASALPQGGWVDRHPPVDRVVDSLIGGQIVFPLVRFAKATNNAYAKRLAYGFIQFIKERSGAFNKEGHLTAKSARYLHSNAGFLKGAMNYAVWTGDDDMVAWVQQNYALLKTLGTDFGFFPHRTSGIDRYQGDISFLKDMIELAIMLANEVDQTYYLDVERFGRNHLLEAQLLDLDWVDRDTDVEFPEAMWCANHPLEGLHTEGVAQKAVGLFASWSLYNDAFDHKNPRLMLRSTAAGMRALYSMWHSAIHREEEAVRINLHFSRDTRWANVLSSLPREGYLEVVMKARGVLAVRIPDEATPEELIVYVNYNRHRNEVHRAGYAWIEALRNGDIVTFRWKPKERKTSYTLLDKEFQGVWRGDTLMEMEPQGTLNPIYMRTSEVETAPAPEIHGVLKEISPF